MKTTLAVALAATCLLIPAMSVNAAYVYTYSESKDFAAGIGGLGLDLTRQGASPVVTGGSFDVVPGNDAVTIVVKDASNRLVKSSYQFQDADGNVLTEGVFCGSVAQIPVPAGAALVWVFAGSGVAVENNGLQANSDTKCDKSVQISAPRGTMSLSWFTWVEDQ